MRFTSPLRLILCGLVLAALAWPATAAAKKSDAPAPPPAAAPPAPPKPLYESQLLRLSQVLGSVDYLRRLCHSEDKENWRDRMKAILDAEAGGEAERIKQLTAAFNRGYRSFAAVYTSCTPSAVAAERQYRREGATLAREIVAKYGN